MRIQVEAQGGRITLHVEGRIAGPWVPELEESWRAALAGNPGETISVDLSGVTCVDQAGSYLLRLMRREGVTFTGAGLLVAETLC